MVGPNTDDFIILTEKFNVFNILNRIKKYNDLELFYRHLHNNPDEKYIKNNNREILLIHIIKNMHLYKQDILEGLLTGLITKFDNDNQINEQDENGWTALMHACNQISNKNGFITVKLLLEMGANSSIRNNNNENAFNILMEYKNIVGPNIIKTARMLKAYDDN
ncbi:repeat protein [Moumouvirus goulette]|uniref:Repeat protein n=1 Tax=Moumouvirus goulette TaxID=1247379 RepID=M1PAY0_9VIRU|nr:repeat protein [Moumouvirus goulette]AGF85014.1 repeat protein [Moumouvirus goulette]